MMSESNKIQDELKDYLSKSDFESAFQVLKRNPMVPLTLDDAQGLLNNLDKVEPPDAADITGMKRVESSNLIYKRLQRQNVLRGFGYVEKAYPENSTDISPLRLEELTGLPISSLTPKQRTTYWRLAGVALCSAEYIIGTQLGIDPLFTLIPGTFFLFGLDQLLYKGAFFETFYQTLVPEYKNKVIAHEAGHFFIAYLLGLPVSNCVTSAWDARKYPEIRGQAGTIFNDGKLIEEMKSSKVSRGSLDRLSVVLMAGIAAEALKFGNAEGGTVDEQELFSLLTQVQPPWNLIRIQGQARWAAVQALLLIKEHQRAYDALFEALCENKSVGDCVLAIERNLPPVLPALERSEQRKNMMKELERNSLLNFVQKITYRVGGLEDDSESESDMYTSTTATDVTTTATTLTKEGYVTRSPVVVSTSSSKSGTASLPPSATPPIIITSTSSASSTTITPDVTENEIGVSVPVSKSPLSPSPVVTSVSSEAVTRFTEIVKLLETATLEGKVNVTEKDVSTGGGIWVNGLRTYDDTVLGGSSVASSTGMPTPLGVGSVALPKPVPGWETKVQEAMLAKPVRGVDLLKTHRSFLSKRLDNQKKFNSQQVRMMIILLLYFCCYLLYIALFW